MRATKNSYAEPGSDEPPVFSTIYNRLLDIKMRDIRSLHIENSDYRYLSERGYVKTKYDYSGSSVKNEVRVTAKGLNFLIKTKTAAFNKLPLDKTNAGDAVFLLASYGYAKEDPYFDPRQDKRIIDTMTDIFSKRLTYMGLMLREPSRTTKRGNDFIAYAVKCMPYHLVSKTNPWCRWWQNFLVKHIPFSEWAAILTKLDDDKKRHYIKLLRSR